MTGFVIFYAVILIRSLTHSVIMKLATTHAEGSPSYCAEPTFTWWFSNEILRCDSRSPQNDDL